MGFLDVVVAPFTAGAEEVLGGATDIVSDITGATAAGEAAERAAAVQAEAAEKGIAEQRRQFDLTQQLLSPFVQAGTGGEGVTGSVEAQQALLGLRGPEAQQAAVDQLQGSPIFQALAGQGEEAILQQASATGGLRGGNVQGALAQFRPGMLNQLIQSRLQNLGGLTQVGQASAAGVGAAGQRTGENVARLLEQQGAARAGGIMGQGGVQQQAFQNLLGIGQLAAAAF
jgi:hypothetical protein